MLIMIWGFILLLAIAVIFLIWMEIKTQNSAINDHKMNHQLKEIVAHLENNLKKSLEIMQDLAKKMHIQQEVLDKTTAKLSQVELQNAELTHLLAKVVTSIRKE